MIHELLTLIALKFCAMSFQASGSPHDAASIYLVELWLGNCR